MSSKKIKKLLGFKPKTRTRAEVDQEYSQHALQLGHKRRVLEQILEDAKRMEDQIQAHLDRLMSLNSEGMRIPAEPPAAQAKAINQDAAQPTQPVVQ